MNRLLLITLLMSVSALACLAGVQKTLRSFTFNELKILSTEPQPQKSLADKLDRLLHSAEFGSFAVGPSGKPIRPVEGGVPVLRATMWNIERGQEFEPITTVRDRPPIIDNQHFVATDSHIRLPGYSATNRWWI